LNSPAHQRPGFGRLCPPTAERLEPEDPHRPIQPVFVSDGIQRGMKVHEKKMPIIVNQCVVYKFQC